MVSSGRPAWPFSSATLPDSMAPVARSRLLMASSALTGFLDFERGLGQLDQLGVEHLLEAVVLALAVMDGDAFGCVDLVEQVLEVEPARLPVADGALLVEAVGLADHLAESAEAELRHDLAHFLGDEEEEIDDVLGLRP